MRQEEKDLVGNLGRCFSDFFALEEIHPADREEFAKAIRQAQNIVLARPGMRQLHPDGYIDTGRVTK